MIAPWNRRELTITFFPAQQAEIRGALAAHGVDYILRIVTRGNPARRGSFGENPALSCEYIFYVHKKDLERAGAVLAGRRG